MNIERSDVHLLHLCPLIIASVTFYDPKFVLPTCQLRIINELVMGSFLFLVHKLLACVDLIFQEEISWSIFSSKRRRGQTCKSSRASFCWCWSWSGRAVTSCLSWLVTLLVVVSFLSGRWPIFDGAFIQRIHIFPTFGAYGYFQYTSLSPSLPSPLSLYLSLL